MEEEDKKVLDSETSTEEESETSEDEESEEGSEEKPNSRTAEARIGELSGKIKELEGKLDEREQIPTPPVNSEQKVDPKVQQAVEQLKKVGNFITQKEFDEGLRTVEERNSLNSEHVRLSNVYDGEDGRPKYDKSKTEEFMRKKAVYDPEIAYHELHRTELLDWDMKKATETKKEKPYVEKQGQTQANRQDNTITREKIKEWLTTPEGRMKYEQNRDKILKLHQQGEFS